MSSQSSPAVRIDLDIRGMHCAGCVATVEKSLRSAAGVASADVNLVMQQATVWVTNSAAPVDVSDLIHAVRAAGYDAAPHEAGRALAARTAERDAALHRQRRALGLMLLAGAPLIAFHAAHLLPGLPPALHRLVGWWLHTPGGGLVQAGLTLVVFALGARDMLAGAWRALRRGTTNMDVLVSLGALTGFVGGLAGLILREPALLIFDSAALIVMFVALGSHLEARAHGQASTALEALAARLPRDALRIVAGRTEAVPIDDVRPGDLLRVPAHALVPVDGLVVAGQGTVDESLVTGESMPVERKVGDRLLGGTRVADGLIDLRATTTGDGSTAAQLARLVEQAQAAKPPWQRLADRLAGIFVPVVLLLALGTFAGWLWLGRAEPVWALQRTIAVLVVACPCALGLAIPTAVLVGTTRAAERGILVRDASALEVAGHVREVLLDKTGTLTLGVPAVAHIEPIGDASAAQVLMLAAALEQLSEHPLARSIVRAARERGVTPPTPEDFASRPGGGVRGQIEGSLIVVGSAEWLNENEVATDDFRERADRLAADGLTVVWVARDSQVVGLLGLADPLHPESATAVDELRRLGVRTRLLSGDRHAAVSRIAGLLKIEAFEAQLTPAQKLARVRAASGHGRVAMVGDGINDAPALAAADVGIAIGAGADVARQAAPICLVGHSPRLIPEAIRISRASARIMKQNLAWALLYNAVMLPVAVLTPLPPALAAAAMMCSSLSVVANSLRLRRAL